MPYTLEQWNKRIGGRTDLSTYITHLTRATSDLTTGKVLMKILSDQKIIGSNPGSPGFIVGNNPAVCFQDTPLLSLGQNILHEQDYRKQMEKSGVPKVKVRYLPYGLAFRKVYAYNKGARPVIYESTELAKTLLPEEEHWRIVNFNLSNKENIIDWTHEREWRIKGDFEFQLSEAVLLVSNETAYKWFIDNDNKNLLKKLAGVVCLRAVIF
ncbi:DUF2971 domain-containing protein [Cohnella faecalis]|uniref:DUF2971 domain-containing protein n=1 Tax=Cohnella faecalis TaxID=2315694 RepID=A0A398CSM4_9BACL|nr:DUF2971 domain-containing protein [Cohnella faecalis]RIE03748.1 DUF2971 domain-containing protein [Cohnella faecalis]